MTQPRLFLLLGNHQLLAQHRVGKSVISTRTYADTGNDQAEFAQFLSTLACSVYLLTDLVEENFQLVTLPHLSGSSRRIFLQRKLAQLYPDTAFRRADVVRKNHATRKEIEVLFSALTRPELLTPWLKILHDAKLPLAAIHSVAHLSSALLHDITAEHSLLMSWNRGIGVRSSYFRAGHLCFSRLTPTTDTSALPPLISAELEHTHHYLKSQGWLAENELLEVSLLVDADDIKTLQNHLANFADVRCSCIDIATLIPQQNTTNSDASALLLHTLTTHRHTPQYANTEQLHDFQIWTLRRYLWATSTALIAFFTLWIAAILYPNNSPEPPSLVTMRQQLRASENEIQILRATIPSSGVVVDKMMAAVTLTQSFFAPSPAALLQPLSLVMQDFVDLELDELAWQTSAPTNSELTLTTHRRESNNNVYQQQTYLAHFQQALQRHAYTVTLGPQPLDAATTLDDRATVSNSVVFKISQRSTP